MKQEFFHIFLSLFIFSYFSQHLPQISSKLWFILSKLWCVIVQLSQNRPRHRCLFNFFQNFFKYTGYNTFVRLINSLVRIQSAARVLLQKELIIPNTKLLLKMTNSNLKKTWTNTALFEFGLAKSDIRQLPWPKVRFKDDFLFLILPSGSSRPFHKMGK